MKLNLSTLTVGLVLTTTMFVSAISLADEEKNISVFVKKVNADAATVDLKVNGNAEVFTLPKLEDGESQTITTESGKSYTVKRVGDGFSVTTDSGEVIDLPMVDSSQLAAKVISLHGDSSHIDKDTITIMGGDLTPDQIETIKASIASAGITKKVKFIKGMNMSFVSLDGEHSTVDLKGGNMEYEFHTEKDVQLIETDDGKKIKKIVIKKDSDNDQ